MATGAFNVFLDTVEAAKPDDGEVPDIRKRTPARRGAARATAKKSTPVKQATRRRAS
jgi:hypothetical protein